MATPETTTQLRAIVRALSASVMATAPTDRPGLLRDIPVYPQTDPGLDFDEVLGAEGAPEVARARLESTGNDSLVFLGLLVGACSRPDDSLAMGLIEALPPQARIQTSRRSTIRLANGFAASPAPSSRLLERITGPSRPLDFLQHKHSSSTGIQALVREIANASIRNNSAMHLPLLMDNPALAPHLIEGRHDFWLLVSNAASSLSPASMGALASLQDRVFSCARPTLMTPSQKEREQLATFTTFHEAIEKLASTIKDTKKQEAVEAMVGLLSMDIPMDPNDYTSPAGMDWRVAAVLAPIQSTLGQAYTQKARSLLRDDNKDVIVDAMVFGSDEWWEECLDHVQANPSAMLRDMEDFNDFLENELEARIVTEEYSRLGSVIDEMHAKNPELASALSTRLTTRLPRLVHAASSRQQRDIWASGATWFVSSSDPMTASMFQSIILGMTTDPHMQAAKSHPRM